jgi:hypothetical protein
VDILQTSCDLKLEQWDSKQDEMHMQPVDTTHGGNDPSAGMGARTSQYPDHEPVKTTLLYTDEASM